MKRSFAVQGEFGRAPGSEEQGWSRSCSAYLSVEGFVPFCRFVTEKLKTNMTMNGIANFQTVGEQDRFWAVQLKLLQS